jgi:cell division protease FtsH
MASPPNPPPTPPAAPAPSRRPGVWLPGGGVAIALLLALGLVLILVEPYKKITYSEFEQVVDAGEIKKFKLIGSDRAHGELREEDGEWAKKLKLSNGQFSVILPASDNQYAIVERIKTADQAVREAKRKVDANAVLAAVEISREEEQMSFLGPFLWTFIPLVAFGLFFVLYILPRMRDNGGGPGFLNNYIRSPARRYEKGKTRVTFEDVAGMSGAKTELQEIVDFLRNPEKFTRLGAQVPKGVLLVGPPGTGKTLLAKAVAGEANVPFFSINGSEFIQMFVGVGASRVRDLFKTAKENAPCLIFIDEIDAVGRMRGAGVGGGSDEREQTLNQILSEMDGFHPNETVIVMAATNRPDVLDTALLRPGRFDRHVTVDRPNWSGRLAILKVHTKTKPIADSVDLEKIARAMIGMSGADLRNLCNEAALVATRAGKNRIEQGDFDAAADRVRLGAKRESVVSADEKRRTAYHEAGHALCAWLEPKAHRVDRVSVVPRERTGGVTMFSPDEDRIDRSYNEFLADLTVLLGGRAADLLTRGEPLSGAVQDIRQATQVARRMVTQYGMSDRLGPVHYRQGDEHVFLGKEIAEARDFSEGTARIIDEEVQRILSNAEVRATELLKTNREDLERLADFLVQNEEIDRDGLELLLRKGGEPAGSDTTEMPAVALPAPKLAFGGA